MAISFVLVIFVLVVFWITQSMTAPVKKETDLEFNIKFKSTIININVEPAKTAILNCRFGFKNESKQDNSNYIIWTNGDGNLLAKYIMNTGIGWSNDSSKYKTQNQTKNSTSNDYKLQILNAQRIDAKKYICLLASNNTIQDVRKTFYSEIKVGLYVYSLQVGKPKTTTIKPSTTTHSSTTQNIITTTSTLTAMNSTTSTLNITENTTSTTIDSSSSSSSKSNTLFLWTLLTLFLVFFLFGILVSIICCIRKKVFQRYTICKKCTDFVNHEYEEIMIYFKNDIPDNVNELRSRPIISGPVYLGSSNNSNIQELSAIPNTSQYENEFTSLFLSPEESRNLYENYEI